MTATPSRLARDASQARPVCFPVDGDGPLFLPEQVAFWPERAPRGSVRDTRRALAQLRAAMTSLKRSTTRPLNPTHLAWATAILAELRKWERALKLHVDRVRGLRR